jgi:hypothetical protein
MAAVDYDSDRGGEKRSGSIPKLDPNRYEASLQALKAFMMGRYSAHEGLKPKPVRKKPAEGITAVKRRALKKEYKIQHNLDLREYNKKKNMAYSIIYKACKKNATTIISRSAYIKNCEIEVIDPTAIGLLTKFDEIYKTKESLNLSKAKKSNDCIMVRPHEDLLEFLQRFDVTILGMTNCSQPPTDEVNCLTL